MIRKLISDDPRVRFEEPDLPKARKREMWHIIRKATVKKNPARFLPSPRARMWILGAAAAVAAVLVMLPLLDEKPGEKEYFTIRDIETDFDPTVGDVLLKSGDRTVRVEADHADVVYESEGKMTVNSQEITPKREDAEEKREIEIDQLIVPYGKMASLTLDDGTIIWVNSGSKLLYPSTFADDKREVFLIGEAYFDVAKDENRPFTLMTDGLNVEVRGTSFNVSAYGNEPLQTVALVSGNVDVRDEDGKMTCQMAPDQLFSYNRLLGETGIRNVDVEEYTSWIHGYLLLRNESLDMLFTRIGRHFNVRINYDPLQMRNITVSGKLDLQYGIGKALETIAITAPITWVEESGEVAVELRSR